MRRLLAILALWPGLTLASVTDNFPSTGALSANWTSISGGDFTSTLTVASANNVGTSVTFSAGAAIYTGAGFSDTQTSQVTVQTTPGAAYNVGACVRMTATGNGYCFDSANSPQLKVYTAKVGAWIGSCSGAPTIGQTLQITATGTTIAGLVNGVQVCSATDSTYSSGSPGILVDENSSSTVRLGSFVATGEIAGAGSTGSGMMGFWGLVIVPRDEAQG